MLTDIQPVDLDEGGVVEEPPRNTAKAQLPPSCVLRRSAFNRTNLFVPEAQQYEERRCSSSLTQYVDRDSRFHSLVALNNRTAADYQSTSLHCWHDSMPFDGPVVPLPKSYDASQRCFVVFGCFCSLSCAKAFLSERSTYETGMQLVLLERMAAEVYGIKSEIVAAPPRLSLDVYGGPYSLERFRSSAGAEKEVTLHIPPFVASYMVCKERTGEVARVSALGVNGISSVRGLRRPAEPVKMVDSAAPADSPYLEFLKSKGVAATEAPTRTSKRVAQGRPKNGGTLAKFMED